VHADYVVRKHEWRGGDPPTKPMRREGAHGKGSGRNHLPRKSSPEGIRVRAETRLAATPTRQPLGANANQYTYHKPGSRNPRKVGR